MKRLELLDYGRFFAATIVVLFHYTFNGIANGKISSIDHIPSLIEITKYGYLGVNFFFMISGYVIFFSAQNRSASQFAISRAVRLYPSFWFAVFFTSSFALIWGGTQMSVYPSQIVANLTMISPIFDRPYVDGVYWTLMYELSFYSAVLIILLMGLQRWLNVVFLCWPLIMLLALLLDKSWLPYLGGYYYYFAAGALFAIVKGNNSIGTYLILTITYFLCIYFSTGNASILTKDTGAEYSEFVIALVISFFYIFFLFLNTKKGESLTLPKSYTIGALTYPVYLIHAHFGYMFLSQFATNENKYLVYFLAISFVLSVSYFMHLVIEVKLHIFWKTFFFNTIGKTVSLTENIIEKSKRTYFLRLFFGRK